MRIAVVCTDTGIRVPDTKGASLHLMAISRAFAGIGHEVLLVAVAGHGSAPAEVRAVLVPHPGWSTGIRREVRKLRTVRRTVQLAGHAVKDFGPDVVYERLSLFGTAGRLLASATGALHVIEVNSLIAEEEVRWRGLRLAAVARTIERTTLERAGLLVAVSDELASAIRDRVPGRPTVVVRNGVDASAFVRLPDRLSARTFLGLPLDRPIVGFAGSLRPWHGVDVAVEALARLPGVILAVAGGGELRSWLEELARRRGVDDQTRWFGEIPHGLMPGFLAALDVALLPYPPLDGFAFSPLKLFEYLASGVPIVASDLGQIRDVLEGGRWGRLVVPGDPFALADAIREILHDPDDSRERAARARSTTLEAHSWEQRARYLTEVVEHEHAGALAC